MTMVFRAFMLALLMFQIPADAQTMQQMFDSIGAQGNVTAPGAYQGQTRSTYTGGRLTMTVPNNNYQLVNISPPKITNGCSGINIYGGSFSLIDKQQFVDMVKNIGQVALAQAFYMAIDALTPMVGANLKQLSDTINKANWNNISACEAGKATANFAAGAAAKTYEAAKGLVVQSGPGNNQCADATDCKTTTVTAAQTSSGLNQLKASGAVNYVEGNIVYQALNDYGSLTLADIELFQSFTGTMVFNVTPGTSNPIDFKYIPPTITDFKVLMGSDKFATKIGNVKVISCTKNADIKTTCDNPDIDTKDINQTPFLAMVYNKMNAIATALRTNNAAMDPALVSFVNSTPIPVYKMLSVATGMKGSGIADAMIDKYSDLVAAEYARAYVLHAYQVVFEAMDRKTADFTDEMRKSYAEMRANRSSVMKQMNDELNKVYVSAMSINSMAQDIQQMERVLSSNMPSYLNDGMKWQRAQMGGS